MFWREHTMRRHGLRERNFFRTLKDSAPLKLPTRNCLYEFFPHRLESISNKMAISLTTPDYPKVSFKVSPLCYACKTYTQYQVAVKLLGSFRLTAGNRHLHRYCIFTEQIPETVLQSLYHSCTSELHVPSLISKGTDYIFISMFSKYLVHYTFAFHQGSFYKQDLQFFANLSCFYVHPFS